VLHKDYINAVKEVQFVYHRIFIIIIIITLYKMRIILVLLFV